jgi:hypothetical protein
MTTMMPLNSQRFVIAEYDILPSAGLQLIILSDFTYWESRMDDLEEWCKDHGSTLEGVTMTCPTKYLSNFLLRWS